MPKLHIPILQADVLLNIADSLNTIKAVPLCGRQLNNHRSARAQDSANAVTCVTVEEYLDALAKGKACRHCGRAAGILPKLTRVTRDNDEESDADE